MKRIYVDLYYKYTYCICFYIELLWLFLMCAFKLSFREKLFIHLSQKNFDLIACTVFECLFRSYAVWNFCLQSEHSCLGTEWTFIECFDNKDLLLNVLEHPGTSHLIDLEVGSSCLWIRLKWSLNLKSDLKPLPQEWQIKSLSTNDPVETMFKDLPS